MKGTKIQACIISLALIIVSECAGKVSQKEADKLGNELTPIGAERAGNADGSIPEWTGGYSGNKGYTNMGELEDPFSDDEILFTISAENADEYKDKISPGQYNMLKKYPSWKMHVYPSHRSIGFNKDVNASMKRNALNSELTDGGYGVKNAELGSPFPIPNSALEIVWNNIISYFLNWEGKFITGAVTASGDPLKEGIYSQFTFPYTEKGATTEDIDNILWKTTLAWSAPPLDAGKVVLVVEHVNQKQAPRDVWLYDPGVRRVRRSPSFVFDSPMSDGQSWSDLINGFNGSPERFDFKLIGKKEMYIPYNTYKVTDRSLKYSEILQPGHFNPEFLRYELHRVWVVEATLKPGASHISPKRMLYFDEDSFRVYVSDVYDSRGNLWRIVENYEPWDYVSKGIAMRLGAIYDLNNGRYAFDLLRNEERTPIKKNIQYPSNDFLPRNLPHLGR